MSNIEKIKRISVQSEDNWLVIAEELERNEAWLDKSASIAALVLSVLREKNMTKQELANKMGVKAQYISRLVKGSENLTLETICKLESALGRQIISISDTTDIIVPVSDSKIINFRDNRIWLKGINSRISQPQIPQFIPTLHNSFIGVS